MNAIANTLTAEMTQTQTRERLLEAAGQVFADVGYRSATVREICRRAFANIAAVNYHFGDKARLYSETLRYFANATTNVHPFRSEATDRLPPERQLCEFIRAFFLRIFSDDRSAVYGRMIAREMIEPTHALDERVDETMRPMSEQLKAILRKLLGPSADEDDVRKAGCSVVGQITFYKHCRPIVERLFSGQSFTVDGIGELVDHIVEFSTAGIREMRKRIESTARQSNIAE